jgi:hypothetical protein
MSPHLNYQVACARQNAIAAHTLHAHHAAEWRAADQSRRSLASRVVRTRSARSVLAMMTLRSTTN